jgi:pantothenate synthetase
MVLAPPRRIRRACPERITTAGVKHMGDLELIILASVASLVCLIASLWINNEGAWHEHDHDSVPRDRQRDFDGNRM